jgi:hypothetical protein
VGKKERWAMGDGGWIKIMDAMDRDKGGNMA